MIRTLTLLFALASVPAAAATATPPEAPAMTKNTQVVEVSVILDHPAEAVWQAVGVDYGRIADSHPKIVASNYVHGSLVGELGAERDCWFNEDGTQKLHERIVGFDSEEMVLTNRILETWRFPVDVDNSLGIYDVDDLGDGRSRFTVTFEFRTRPAMMGPMMKGAFRSLLHDYMIALDHHLETGETVNATNFKAIKKDSKRAARS